MKMRMKHNIDMVASNHVSKPALSVDPTNVEEGHSMAAMSSHRFLSSDLVRTKQFDSSSKQMNPSLLRGHASSSSSYQEIDREEYCAPCVRVGRFYTISAAGLTLKQAAKVAKQMSNNQKVPKKIIGFALSATAPDAFRATQRIAEIAETGKMPQKQKKQQTVIHIPSVDSPLSLREGHRLIRSEPMYSTIRPTPHNESPFGQSFNQSNNGNGNNGNTGGFGGTGTVRDFNSWDPESVDETVNEKEKIQEAYVTPGMKLDLKVKAAERFSMAVDVVVRSGVITAGGSGNRAPIPSMNHTTLNSIIARVPSLSGFLDEHHMQHMLAQELSNVQDAYYRAAARACVEYDIKDPVEAIIMGVNTMILYDESANELWTNKEYQVSEWRVQRLTKVSAKKVLRTYRVIDKALRSSLQTMLELHYLWLDDALPRVWWEGEIGVECCPYSQMLFTDVNQPGFQLKLPMLLDDFVSHIEGHSKDIRDALLEFWIISVGGKLSAAVSRLKDEKKISETEGPEGDSERERERMQMKNRDSEEDSEDDDNSQASGEYKKFQKALKNRMVLEGVEDHSLHNTRNSSKGGNHIVKETKKKNSAERMVSTAVVLLSRQLRGMCEASLQSMAELFEKLSRPLTSEYSGEEHSIFRVFHLLLLFVLVLFGHSYSPTIIIISHVS